jgi:glyoxylase-like metal-dependent hydrolase (beta-lactamase superfamily II)
VYVLESAGGPVLVDAGWDDPSSWQALTAGLRAVGTAVTDVYGVLLTHHHPDHAGLAARVREESGAWIVLHSQDAAVLRWLRDPEAPGDPRPRRMAALMEAAGAPSADIAALRAQSNRPAPATAVPDREISDWDMADVPGRRLRALWTPGHTPGHTCFYLETERLLLSGDHLLPRITPHVALFSTDASDPLGDFLGSLNRLAALDAAGVLPAHEHSFTGASQRAREIADHHRARLRELEAALPPDGATLWEVAQTMRWNRPWEQMTAMSRQMALGEAAAHVRYLTRRGRIRETAGGPPARYQRAS